MWQISFQKALYLVLKFLKETLDSVSGLYKEQVRLLIDRFIETVPRIFRTRLLFWPHIALKTSIIHGLANK